MNELSVICTQFVKYVLYMVPIDSGVGLNMSSHATFRAHYITIKFGLYHERSMPILVLHHIIARCVLHAYRMTYTPSDIIHKIHTLRVATVQCDGKYIAFMAQVLTVAVYP